MKLKNGCEGRASGLICEIVNSVGQGILYLSGRRQGISEISLWLWQSFIMLLILSE